MILVNRWLLLALLMYGCTPADGAIYRCIDETSAVLYSQFPCANAELVPERQVSVIDTPPFSESERLMLKHIEQNSLALELASRKRAKWKHRQREKRKTNETVLCRQALVGIANLRARKRAGYSLSEATALGRRETELRRQQAQNC